MVNGCIRDLLTKDTYDRFSTITGPQCPGLFTTETTETEFWSQTLVESQCPQWLVFSPQRPQRLIPGFKAW